MARENEIKRERERERERAREREREREVMEGKGVLLGRSVDLSNKVSVVGGPLLHPLGWGRRGAGWCPVKGPLKGARQEAAG